jgi:diguanylate cyclase (GGDEF)-like protein
MMSDFSMLPAIVTGVSVGTAALSLAGWLQCRRRLAASWRERAALEKSSSLLGAERQLMDRMNGGASLREVLDILTRSIEAMAPECFCTVMLLDKEGKRLWEGSRGGLPEEYMRAINGLAIGPEVGACGSAAYRNETVVVEDISTDPRFAPVKDFVMSFGLMACWSVPIAGLNQQVLGTFALYHRRPAKPRERELKIVEAAAQLAANAIERLRATERQKENEERIALAEKAAFLGIWELDVSLGILTLSQELAAQAGLADAAHQISMSQLRSMIYADDWPAVVTAMRDASPESTRFHAEFRIVLFNGLIRWLRTQANVEFADKRAKRMIGVSVDITREKEMLEELHFLAAHDGLTGIWNRKAIFDLMHRELEMAARLGTTTGLMMLDLDHFKDVNDTYGHPAGDAVLRESARRLQQAVRSYDLVGRYGGEEFLVVLPHCDRGQVEECAERVRAAIAEEQWVAEGVPIRISASIGATVVDPSENAEHEGLVTADAALYDAKTRGRNCVVYRVPQHSRRESQRDLSQHLQ